MSGKRIFLLFLLLITILNIAQSCFTELLHDEAYYWLWSTQLAWGYFDHPPMIAFFIYLGDSIFHHEIGVRMVSVLAHAATLYVLYLLVEPKNVKLFIILLISMTPLLGAGFIAVPDGPLLLFTACFYLFFKKYTSEDTWASALCLGVFMSLMLYSKYHGVLVLFFVILSDISLLKRKSFYAACLLGALLFTPHLWWQYQHDFPTLRFHFFERAKDVYVWTLTGEFIGGQILMAGVPTGLMLLYAMIQQKAENKFERALKFQLWGVYIFFLLSTIKGKTEAHWTAVNLIPLTVLGYRFMEKESNFSYWLIRLVPLSVLTVLLIRIHYGTHLTKKYLHVPSETQDWKAWAQHVKADAGELPVVFFSAYSRAAKYSFYTGSTSLCLTEVMMRKSQYGLWPIEEALQNKPVYVCSFWNFNPSRPLRCSHAQTDAVEYYGCSMDSFLSWMKIQIEPQIWDYKAKASEEITVPVSVLSPYKNHPAPNSYSRITYQVYGDDKLKRYENETGILLGDALSSSLTQVRVKVPDVKGRYMVFISVSQDNFPATINSRAVRVQVD